MESFGPLRIRRTALRLFLLQCGSFRWSPGTSMELGAGTDKGHSWSAGTLLRPDGCQRQGVRRFRIKPGRRLRPAADDPSVQVAASLGTLTFAALNTKNDNVYVNSLGGYTGQVSLSLTGLPPGVTYSFNPATVKLTSAKPSKVTVLSISPADAVLPLSDNYTVLVQASAAGGGTSYAPIRLLTRSAVFSSVTNAGCNSSNQMNVSLRGR